MKEITQDNFDTDVLGSTKPILVDFWGPQCGPCLALTPQLEKLQEDVGAQVEFSKVEAPKNRRLCLRLKVLSLPTILFFKGGDEVGRLTGDVTIGAIEETIKSLV